MTVRSFSGGSVFLLWDVDIRRRYFRGVNRMFYGQLRKLQGMEVYNSGALEIEEA